MESVVFSALAIDGHGRAGTATIHVHGNDVLTRASQIKIGTIDSRYLPKVAVSTLFGVAKSGAWGLLSIDTDGDICLTHLYDEGELTWGSVSVSVTYTY